MWMWRWGEGTTAKDEFIDQVRKRQAKLCGEGTVPSIPKASLRASGQGRPAARTQGSTEGSRNTEDPQGHS